MNNQFENSKIFVPYRVSMNPDGSHNLRFKEIPEYLYKSYLGITNNGLSPSKIQFYEWLNSVGL